MRQYQNQWRREGETNSRSAQHRQPFSRGLFALDLPSTLSEKLVFSRVDVGSMSVEIGAK